MKKYLSDNSVQKPAQVNINTPSYPTRISSIPLSNSPITRDGATLASDGLNKLSEALSNVNIRVNKNSAR